MILKELRIKNFRSYYGDNNVFKFSDGLTLILGDSGDGKTTFFEALQWLFYTKDEAAQKKNMVGNLDLVSEMRKSKLEVGEHDEVCVSLTFDHDGIKTIEKSFSFERTDKGFRSGEVFFRGYEEINSERVAVSGDELVKRCYDASIRKFSMFKGESQLNVLTDSVALKQLVDKYSDIRDFDNLVNYANEFEDKSNKAYMKEVKSDTKTASEAKMLDGKLTVVSKKIFDIKADIKDKTNSLNTFNGKLTTLEGHQEASKQFKELQEILKRKKDKLTHVKAIIGSVNYNNNLLDKYWLLCAFMPVLNEYKQKCARLSKEKRQQERDFDKQQAAAKAKLETIKEVQGALINGATELPWYLPDQETMEEMLHDHVCKVCGRPAPEGSDAYNFMLHKLEDYKKHVEMQVEQELAKKAIDEQVLFKHNNVEQLHSLSIALSGSQESKIAGLRGDIYDTLDFISSRKKELKKIEEEVQEVEDDKARLLIQTGNVSEALLESEYNDIKGLFDQKNRAEVRLAQLNGELSLLEEKKNELQARLDELKPESSLVKRCKDVHRVLEEIAKAFTKAKKENLSRFLGELEDRSNMYLHQLSTIDFHGKVHIFQDIDESARIKLFSTNANGEIMTEVKLPSESQKTNVYISVLFAISDFTKQKRSEDYPLIFDAPTSSFGDMKQTDFYSVIDQVHKQCIIATKDFIYRGDVNLKDIDSLHCPVYRIKKADGLDQNNLATVRTLVSKLK